MSIGRRGESRTRKRTSIDIECDIDPRNAFRRRWDAEELVVADKLALTLVDSDLDRGLAVRRRRERLCLLRQDGHVARDKLRHDAAERLDTERERGYI